MQSILNLEYKVKKNKGNRLKITKLFVNVEFHFLQTDFKNKHKLFSYRVFTVSVDTWLMKFMYLQGNSILTANTISLPQHFHFLTFNNRHTFVITFY